MPSGLTLYWFTNNLITTAQQVYLRKSFTPAELPAGAVGTIVKPKEPEEPKGPTGKDLNARRSAKAASQAVIDVEAETVSGNGTSLSTSSSAAAAAAEKARQGEKFRAIKAREAARKAAEQASSGAVAAAAPQMEAAANGGGESVAAAPVVTEVAAKLEVPETAPSKEGGFKQQSSNGARGKVSGKKGGKKK